MCHFLKEYGHLGTGVGSVKLCICTDYTVFLFKHSADDLIQSCLQLLRYSSNCAIKRTAGILKGD